MTAKFYDIFKTPLMIVDPLIDDQKVNDRIKELVLENMATTPNVQRSNRHGWESDIDFHAWDDDAIRSLKKAIHNMVVQMSARELGQDPSSIMLSLKDSALANVGERGAYHMPHLHRNCSWSCVYYADVPTVDEERCGQLELLDPRTNPIVPGIHRRKAAVSLQPKTGLGVCFPSWLEHWVRPWESDAQRISIAWNVTIAEVRQIEARNS